MPWSEFAALLSGISHDTPLGRIVEIRSETDRDRLKHYTPDQKKIRHDWRTRQAQKMIESDPDYARAQVNSFQEACKAAFSKG